MPDPLALPAFEELRKRAEERLRALAVPSVRDEEWKYTDIRPFLEREWLDAAEAHAQEVLPLPDLEGVRIAFRDGRFEPALSRLDGLPPGVTVGRLATADDRAAILEHLARYAPLEDRVFPVAAHRGEIRREALGYFGSLNTASFVDGAWIRVARGVEVEVPVHVAFVGTGGAHAPRLLVILEEGARATLVESYSSAGEAPHFTCSVTEVAVGANAHLEHVRLQDENEASVHVHLAEVHQERDATYLNFAVVYGGELVRNDLNVFLAGENGHCRVDGVVALGGRQHVDNHTRLDHASPHCDSFEVYKHVLNDEATAVFNGKIFVHQDAQRTDAKQTNQTLLLSPRASINTKPQLEIFADDVKCTHGATVGQLREDALFYMKSRGLGDREARALLIYAFAAEVLEKIEHEGLRSELERRLFQKLGTDRV